MPDTRARRAARAGLALLAALLVLAPVASASASAPAAEASPYRDISGVSPLARNAIVADARLGIMTGTAPERFNPAGLVTRAQAVRLIVRTLAASHAIAAVPTARAALPYTDVTQASPYDPSLALALKLGILPTPAAKAAFGPSRSLARSDLALWVLAASLQGAAAAPKNPYDDLGHLAAAARASVLTATALGLVPPGSAKAWDPSGTVTRAQLAITLYRLYTLMAATLPASLVVTAATPAAAEGASDALSVSALNAAGKAIPAAELAPYRIDYTFTASGGGAPSDAQVTNGAFTASAAGSYGVEATLSGGDLAAQLTAAPPSALVVYGPPSQAVLSAPPSLVADGLDAATVTITVEDSGGRTVENYNGAITVSSSAASVVGIVGPQGRVATAPLTVVAHNGVAQVSVRAGNTSASQAAINAVVGDGVRATATIATAAQVATAVEVQAASSAMSDKAGTMDVLTAEVVDQAGFPMAAGTYPIAFQLTQSGTAARLDNAGTPRGNGPVTLTFVGGSARPPTLDLEATGNGSGSVAVDVTASGVKPGSTTVEVVGSTPPSQAGTIDGLSITPQVAGSATVAVGGTELYSLSYTAGGTSPLPAPAALSVTLTAPSTDGGSVAFTDLPPGATSSADGTSATVTMPAGTTTVDFGVTGESAGEVVLTAQTSYTPSGATTASVLNASLPVTVAASAENPVTAVELSVGGQTSVIGEGTTGGGVSATVPSAGTELPVTITLIGSTGQPVFAPQTEVVVLSDQGLAAAPDNSQVPANTMSAGGSFQINGVAASPIVAIPQGSSSTVVTYTNQVPGTYTLEAEVLDLTGSGLSAAQPSPASGPYTVDLAAVGVAPGDMLGNLGSALEVLSNQVAQAPTGEQATESSPGVYSVSVPWSGTPPPVTSLYAQIQAAGPAGPQEVPLGAPPALVNTDTLTASPSSLAVPASSGSATITYTVTADGKPAAGVVVQVVLTNAVGSGLSLASAISQTLEKATTGTNGTATVTVYGSVVPEQGSLTATLPSEPTLAPVTTPVTVVASGNNQLIATPTELGATQFTADQGGEPLTFEVESPGQAPVAGVTVDFALATGSSGLSLSAKSATTNKQGNAVVRVRGYTTSAEGAVVASLPSVPGVSVTTGPITVTAGKPAEFSASLPPGDTITADAAHNGLSLLVIVQDQYGNPVPGPLTLNVSATGPLTLAAGQATAETGAGGQAALALADPNGAMGQSSIVVTDSQDPALGTTIPITVTSGAPAQVTAQPLATTTSQVGGTVPVSLSATDAFGNPVSGTYAVTIGGTAVSPSPNGAPSPGTTTEVTFQNGTPVAPILVNPVLAQSAGAVTVSVNGLAPVTVPGTLDIAPGDTAYAVLQSLMPAKGSALSATPATGPWTGMLTESVAAPTAKTAYTAMVQVMDRYGNPVAESGMAIDVLLTPEPGGSAQVSTAQLSTDANGQATFTYTTSAASATRPATGDQIALTLEYTSNQTTVTTGGY